MIKKSSSIVISTDVDREGEMFARELIELAGYRGNIQRCWLSALDSAVFKRPLRPLKRATKPKLSIMAGLTLSRSDWLVGINFSCLFTLLAQRQCYVGKPLSVGRVQRPTLAMVVNRDLDIAHFVPKNHYTLAMSLATQ